jgi:hypothetical protein
VRATTTEITCERCGWIAVVAPASAKKVWDEHVRRNRTCAEEHPVNASTRRSETSPFRAPLCVKGHERAPDGSCPQCRAAARAAQERLERMGRRSLRSR